MRELPGGDGNGLHVDRGLGYASICLCQNSVNVHLAMFTFLYVHFALERNINKNRTFVHDNSAEELACWASMLMSENYFERHSEIKWMMTGHMCDKAS